MNILVSGAGGFVGRHLVPLLASVGHEVTTVNSRECDLTEAGSLDRFAPGRFDQIYHLAAWTQAGTFCDIRRGEQWIINHQINTNVLAWWRKSQPQAKLIALGTSASYSPDREMREENYLSGMPDDKYVSYAYSKRTLLVGMQSLQRQFGMRYLYAIPSTVFGPDYPLDGRQLHFIYDLIRKITVGKTAGKPVVLWGDGHQRRELVYVVDFVRWLIQLASETDNMVVNLGAGENRSIREFAAMICRRSDYDFERIQFDPRGFVGVRDKFLTIEKLNRLLPCRAQTPFEDGLNWTIEWFVNKLKLPGK